MLTVGFEPPTSRFADQIRGANHCATSPLDNHCHQFQRRRFFLELKHIQDLQVLDTECNLKKKKLPNCKYENYQENDWTDASAL